MFKKILVKLEAYFFKNKIISTKLQKASITYNIKIQECP